jgi:hypothetical protein
MTGLTSHRIPRAIITKNNVLLMVSLLQGIMNVYVGHTPDTQVSISQSWVLGFEHSERLDSKLNIELLIHDGRL